MELEAFKGSRGKESVGIEMTFGHVITVVKSIDLPDLNVNVMEKAEAIPTSDILYRIWNQLFFVPMKKTLRWFCLYVWKKTQKTL